MSRRCMAVLFLILFSSVTMSAAGPDPFLWLEEIDGEKAVSWVKKQNSRSTAVLEAVPLFKPILEQITQILDSDARIPRPVIRGEYVYNLWQDADNERGIWRRTSLASYQTAAPEWETVIDIGALGEAEDKPWVFHGATCLAPEYRHCMISLSPGGSDAAEEREFDTVTGKFVENGFRIPEAKTKVTWKDKDSLWIATDVGEGSLTSSGYPRILKEWKRGTSLDEARTLFVAEKDHVWTQGSVLHTPSGRYDLIFDVPVFMTSRVYIRLGDRLVRLGFPEDAEFYTIFSDQVLFSLRTEWTVGERVYKPGSLLAGDLDDLLSGRNIFNVLFEPSDRISLATVGSTADHVLVNTLDNVNGKLHKYRFADGKWSSEEIPLPGIGTVTVVSASDVSDDFFFNYEDFLTPDTLFLSHGGKVTKVKSLPGFFDDSGMKVSQREATSKDGAKIPYFLVTPKGFVANGAAPTMLYGYGGFEISMVPRYSAKLGAAWMERGGVYVLANLRGGGEFGPGWHSAALKNNRIKSFQDFIAVAEDLIAAKITSPDHLGIMGGSQGGLLVGGAFTLRPDLYKAVVCQVPLLDMRRFNKLLAGASWMGEYGNPDLPEEWEYIQTWSPYHLVERKAKYPEVFFWTNTRDDRVHPAHARKMVARMQDMGHKVYYFENIEGGHGSGSVNSQKAYVGALEYAYLWKMLK